MTLMEEFSFSFYAPLFLCELRNAYCTVKHAVIGCCIQMGLFIGNGAMWICVCSHQGATTHAVLKGYILCFLSYSVIFIQL